METNKNLQVFRRVIDEVFNKGNFSVLPELFAPDYVEHQFGMRGTYAGMQADVEFLRRTFPDMHITIEDMTADGDKIWARMTGRATNSVGFMGPPTGKSFEITVFDQCRIRDGKIVEHWGVPDRFAQMAQLGILPKPQPTTE